MTSRVLFTLTMTLLLTSCVRYVQDATVRPHTIATPPTTAVAEAIKRQVKNAIDAGDGDARLAELRRRVALNPDDLNARMEVADAYTVSGYPDIALEHYRVAATRFPDSAEVVVQLARTLRSMNFPVEARAVLQRFIAIQPLPPPEVLSWLAILHDEAGDYAIAEPHHRAAVEQRSGSDSLHNNLGYNLLLQGRNGEAAVEFRRALEIAPDSVVARNNLDMAVSSETGTATAHNNMGALLIEKKNYAGARKELEQALRYKADHPAALNNLLLVSELDGGTAHSSLSEGAGSFWRRFLYLLVGETAATTANLTPADGQQVRR